MSATEYQVTVVGGGPAGLTAALYATRLGHDTAVIGRGGGRAAMMADTHNVIGVTEDVSGVENDGGTVAVDDHGATSVDGVYAVGDATPGHNQIPTAMGEGARAGIDIHYGLREFPKSLEELEAEGGIGPADVPGMAERIRRSARDHEGNVATGVGTETEAKAETEMADD